jgi:hypothetical protein
MNKGRTVQRQVEENSEHGVFALKGTDLCVLVLGPVLLQLQCMYIIINSIESLLRATERSRGVLSAVKMCLNIEEYRARIDSFSGAKWPKKAKGGERREECSMKLWFCGPEVAALLVTGGVEINPGPFSVEKEVQICEIHNRDKKQGSRSQRIRGKDREDFVWFKYGN